MLYSPMPITCAIICILSLLPRQATSHGYLSSPKSRNFYAFENVNWYKPSASDPEPESCPQCLNRGGALAQCGITGSRNYDIPRNAHGKIMKPNIQATWKQGQEVVIDVILTAHHKGHFVFSACPIESVGEIPTQQCFDAYPLMFVQDLLHGGVPDPRYPERAYIAPTDINGDGIADENDIHEGRTHDLEMYGALVAEMQELYGPLNGVAEYSFRMKLPSDLHGDLVLLQWYYLTANSCVHEGYDQYDWPWDYGYNSGKSSLEPCGELSSDGSGAPERFWNCAEVRIETTSGTSKPVVNQSKSSKSAASTAKSSKSTPTLGSSKSSKKSNETRRSSKSSKPNLNKARPSNNKQRPKAGKEDKPGKKNKQRVSKSARRRHGRIAPRTRVKRDTEA